MLCVGVFWCFGILVYRQVLPPTLDGFDVTRRKGTTSSTSCAKIQIVKLLKTTPLHPPFSI
jgi:hypothetical protein